MRSNFTGLQLAKVELAMLMLFRESLASIQTMRDWSLHTAEAEIREYREREFGIQIIEYYDETKMFESYIDAAESLGIELKMAPENSLEYVNFTKIPNPEQYYPMIRKYISFRECVADGIELLQDDYYEHIFGVVE